MSEGISLSNALSTNTSDERSYPFLSEEIKSKYRPSSFLTEDNSKDRPSPFLSQEHNANNSQSPLTIQRGESAEKSSAGSSVNLPKNSSSILTELRKNAMNLSMTARDIANKYEIPYMQAQEIFASLHEDANGIAREFNLPQNSTVSFLV